ncbi:hypothetical protein AAFF_G00390260 [Aldrovandia affinis]|uniref:Uncharacterized protein n=1 Tax=Aldrovandia affinis TaxID=143900 RepID=A0AAD7WM35_9TELE|nr:hypothetical protein AAFF_G00390260 [Aldrovandia affinis]
MVPELDSVASSLFWNDARWALPPVLQKGGLKASGAGVRIPALGSAVSRDRKQAAGVKEVARQSLACVSL